MDPALVGQVVPAVHGQADRDAGGLRAADDHVLAWRQPDQRRDDHGVGALGGQEAVELGARGQRPLRRGQRRVERTLTRGPSPQRAVDRPGEGGRRLRARTRRQPLGIAVLRGEEAKIVACRGEIVLERTSAWSRPRGALVQVRPGTARASASRLSASLSISARARPPVHASRSECSRRASSLNAGSKLRTKPSWPMKNVSFSATGTTASVRIVASMGGDAHEPVDLAELGRRRQRPVSRDACDARGREPGRDRVAGAHTLARRADRNARGGSGRACRGGAHRPAGPVGPSARRGAQDARRRRGEANEGRADQSHDVGRGDRARSRGEAVAPRMSTVSPRAARAGCR